MTVVTVMVLNQTKYRLVHNQKEKCHRYYTLLSIWKKSKINSFESGEKISQINKTFKQTIPILVKRHIFIGILSRIVSYSCQNSCRNVSSYYHWNENKVKIRYFFANIFFFRGVKHQTSFRCTNTSSRFSFRQINENMSRQISSFDIPLNYFHITNKIII